MIGGFILGKMNIERHLSPWIKQMQIKANETFEMEHTPFRKRLPTIIRESQNIVQEIILYMLLGIAIGAAITAMYPKISSLNS